MRVRRAAAAVAAMLWLGGPARAGEAAPRPVVAELFTSEGCSSCPPAEALLAELARNRPDLLVLAFHVTYWDQLGWRDPFGLPVATARQRDYATQLGLETVYTPQLVVNGSRDVIGSDRGAVLSALYAAAATAAPPVPLALQRLPGGARVAAGAGPGHGTLLLIGFDSLHRTPVARGENAGRVLLEANVVRAIIPVGAWHGAALQAEAALPQGEHLALLLQAPDGRILAAAVLP